MCISVNECLFYFICSFTYILIYPHIKDLLFPIRYMLRTFHSSTSIIKKIPLDKRKNPFFQHIVLDTELSY